MWSAGQSPVPLPPTELGVVPVARQGGIKGRTMRVVQPLSLLEVELCVLWFAMDS